MTRTMRGDVDVRVVYSRDQQARSEMRHWEQVAESAPRWRVRHRRKAETRAEEARERAVSAGVDWNLVPRPPQGLRAPDRSRRHGGGIKGPPADGRPSPPPQPSGSRLSAALSGLRLTMHLGTASGASAHAAEPASGEQRDDAPPREPEVQTTESNGSQEPGPPDAGGTGAATAPPATPPPTAPPPPVASVPATPAPAPSLVTSIPTAAAPAAATSGGGLGLAYGSADVGSLTAVSAMDWLEIGPQQVYGDPGGGGFLQAPDGGLWYQDAAGLTYALGPDGTYYALGEDGYLYGQTPDGGYFTWAEDGTQLLPDENGLLWAYTDDGQPMVLGDDGLYYAPDVWAPTAATREEPVLPVEPATEPPPQEGWVATDPPLQAEWTGTEPPPEQASLDTDTEFAEYADQPSFREPGPTPGLGDLAPDPLWPVENGDPAATFDAGEPSETPGFGDPFSEPDLLVSGNWDDGTAVEPSFDEALPPPEDPPPLCEDDIAAESGYLPEGEDVEGARDADLDQSTDEPPAELPSSGWTDGTFDS